LRRDRRVKSRFWLLAFDSSGNLRLSKESAKPLRYSDRLRMGARLKVLPAQRMVTAAKQRTIHAVCGQLKRTVED
jgi:hypothetical protein